MIPAIGDFAMATVPRQTGVFVVTTVVYLVWIWRHAPDANYGAGLLTHIYPKSTTKTCGPIYPAPCFASGCCFVGKKSSFPCTDEHHNICQFSSCFIHMDEIWLVVWNIFYFSIYWELGIIIPIDFHIFQRGWNHQPDMFFPYLSTTRPLHGWLRPPHPCAEVSGRRHGIGVYTNAKALRWRCHTTPYDAL